VDILTAFLRFVFDFVIQPEKERKQELRAAKDKDRRASIKSGRVEKATSAANKYAKETGMSVDEAEKSIVKAQDSALPPHPKIQAQKDRNTALFLVGLIIFVLIITS